MIDIKNLNLKFKNQILLENININLKDNKTLFIVGKSGSGKSTLAKSFIRLFDKNYFLSADKFKINNENVLSLNDDKLSKFRSKVSLIFQNNNIYPLLDIGSYFNIILKTHTNLSKKQRKDLIFYHLKNLGFKDLDLIYHSYIYQLSVGMIKKIELCSCLLCSPKYLICDEITSSLDKENEENIINLIKKIKQNTNIILISHDLKMLDLADYVLFLDNGKMISFGKKDEVLNQEYFKHIFKAYEEFYAKN